MNFKYFVEILKFSAKPLTIIYPIPILQLLVFSLSNRNLNSLILEMAFSFTFYPAVNLWNHVNDIEEDVMGGKYNVFAESPALRFVGVVMALLLYSTSFLMVLKLGKVVSLILFVLCLTLTWFYSDRIIFGRFLRFRLKDHYLTELATFVVSYPAFTLLLWTFFEDLNFRSFALSLTVLFFVLFGIFLKDLRDVSGDEKAGLRTLGVVFSPKRLLKLSYTSIIVYYLTVFIFAYLEIYSKVCLVLVLTFIPTLIYLRSIARNDWRLSPETLPHFKRTLTLNIASIVLLVILNTLTPPLPKFPFR